MSEQEGRRQGSRLPGWWPLTRDVGSFLAGWTLIFMEVQRAELRESVLVFGATVVGVPAAWIGVQTVAEAVTRRSGTSGSSSSPQEEAPSSSLPPSPSGT